MRDGAADGRYDAKLVGGYDGVADGTKLTMGAAVGAYETKAVGAYVGRGVGPYDGAGDGIGLGSGLGIDVGG